MLAVVIESGFYFRSHYEVDWGLTANVLTPVKRLTGGLTANVLSPVTRLTGG